MKLSCLSLGLVFLTTLIVACRQDPNAIQEQSSSEDTERSSANSDVDPEEPQEDPRSTTHEFLQTMSDVKSEAIASSRFKSTEVNVLDAARFSFENEMHDFGEITEGEVVSTTFHFTNTGDVPLIITAAQGSCGCTVPDYPKNPILPGEDGEIFVTFSSDGRPGKIDKTVTLRTNTIPNVKVLRIAGFVQSKKE